MPGPAGECQGRQGAPEHLHVGPPPKRRKHEDIATEYPVVSIITPVHNAALWLDDCFGSILKQTYPAASIQISVYDDASTDASPEIISRWGKTFAAAGYEFIASGGLAKDRVCSAMAGGIGYAKNRAIKQSTGDLLCFFDADDMMLPKRIERQVAASKLCPTALIGGGFVRIPTDATPHYTSWANTTSPAELWLDQFRECTVLMPTWLLPRHIFETVGPFRESAPSAGEGEDLVWFQQFLTKFGWPNQHAGRRSLVRVGTEADPVLQYRYLASSGSWRVSRKQLLRIRAAAFEERVLGLQTSTLLTEVHDKSDSDATKTEVSKGDSITFRTSVDKSLVGDFNSAAGPRPALRPWQKFVIWGAGRDGRAFYGALSSVARGRVECMCDIDPKKVGRDYHNSQLDQPNRVPVIHFTALERKVAVDGESKSKLPVVVCVTRRRKSCLASVDAKSSGSDANTTSGSDGALERNVNSLGLQEGVDLWYFV